MAREITATDRSLFQATMVVRWLSWTWAAIGLAISWQHVVDDGLHKSTAIALIGLALVFTAVTTVYWRTDPGQLATWRIVIIELCIAALLLIGDGYVYMDSRPQSLPWAWPAAGLVAAGVVFGRRWAIVAAIGLALASFIGEGLNDGGEGFGRWGVTASSKAGLYILTALIAGYIGRRLRAAEVEISAARAREEIAVRLHDGVLQTLAVIQRRSTDTELAALARDQERDLRDYLAGTTSAQPGLTASLREAAALYERRHGGRAEVVIADDVEEPPAETIAALAGAVGEALANAGKHADAERVVVYAEPDWEEGIFVSVKDNGVGFDPETVDKRIGLRESITGRIESIGGRVEISSKPGRGTEVRLWAP
jgi:signal transduction histidine kinase